MLDLRIELAHLDWETYLSLRSERTRPVNIVIGGRKSQVRACSVKTEKVAQAAIGPGKMNSQYVKGSGFAHVHTRTDLSRRNAIEHTVKQGLSLSYARTHPVCPVNPNSIGQITTTYARVNDSMAAARRRLSSPLLFHVRRRTCPRALRFRQPVASVVV